MTQAWEGSEGSPAGVLQLLQLILQPQYFAFQLGLHALSSCLGSCSLSLSQLHAACQLRVLCIFDPAMPVLTKVCKTPKAAGIAPSACISICVHYKHGLELTARFIWYHWTQPRLLEQNLNLVGLLNSCRNLQRVGMPQFSLHAAPITSAVLIAIPRLSLYQATDTLSSTLITTCMPEKSNYTTARYAHHPCALPCNKHVAKHSMKNTLCRPEGG